MLNKHTKALLLATCMVAAPSLVYAQSQTTSPPASGATKSESQRPSDMMQNDKQKPMTSTQSGSSSDTSSGKAAQGMPRPAGAGDKDAKPGMAGKDSMSGDRNMTQTQPRTGSMAAGDRSASMKPLATPSPDHMMISDLRGATVYGSNNENVGDIKDVIMTRDGQIDAVVVGVGGFLGIGEKDVAIPFQAIEISERGKATARAGSNEPATTGSVSGDRAAGSATQGTIKPQRIVLRNMTKADLEAAPKFSAEGGSTASGSSAPPRNTNAPAKPSNN